MKRVVFLSLVALFAAFLSIGTTGIANAEAPAHSDVRVIEGKYAELLSAGNDANARWHALSTAEQDAILQFVFPTEFAQGKRPELMAVYNAPALASPSAPQGQPPVENWCTGWYAVTNGNNPGGGSDGPYVDGYGASPAGTTLQLSETRGVSNQFSAEVGIDAQIVSAGVGFNVTHSRDVGYSYSINVPYGETWRIQATNIYRGVGFDIWDDDCGDPVDTFIGRGTAWEFTNLSYNAWRL